MSHIAVSLFVYRDQSYICSKLVDSKKKKNLRKKPEAHIIPNYLQKTVIGSLQVEIRQLLKVH